MSKVRDARHMTTVVLVILFVFFAGLSGYLYVTKTQGDNKIAELTDRLSNPKFKLSIQGAEIKGVDAGDSKVAILDKEKEEIILSVNDKSGIFKTVLSKDKKYKNYSDAKISDIKTGDKVSVTYNGLNELEYLAVE